MIMPYIDLKYKPSKDDLICSFRVEPTKGLSVKKAAEKIAEESSIGTWTTVKTMSPRIQKIGAKVYEIKGKWVKIAYPWQLFEPGNMPEIMSSIGGNIFGMKSIDKLRLEDIEWPKKIMNSFKGPKFGIEGIRKILKVKKRPLVGTIVKPKLGLNEKEHAKVAYQAWIGGCDIVKDDENLTSQNFNRFEKRVKETLKMRDKAERETGEKKAYMPNVTAETKEMIKRAKFVKNHGGRYAMVDIITMGWSGLQSIRNEDLGLILHAHRAGHAAFTRGNHGISMLVIADIARLIGVDQIHIGTVVGKMVGSRKEVTHIEDEIEKKFIKDGRHTLEENWGKIKTVFAVCSGGLHPGLVQKLIKIMGKNIIIQAGGGIHWNPRGTKYGAMGLRQAVDAVMERIPLKEYAKTHLELKEALDKWD
ncbi:MAG: type III ribulose-bisphosphate carboxylase [Candidatus Aenigmarchaeota archaeon]|nr:type III ribulose-bisphosphate carboxylase [Candidatus Aenigmarchaeota archaeon]